MNIGILFLSGGLLLAAIGFGASAPVPASYRIELVSPAKTITVELAVRFAAPVDPERPLLEQKHEATASYRATRIMRSAKESEALVELANPAVTELLFAIGESEIFSLPPKRPNGFEPIDPFNIDGMAVTITRTINGRETMVSRNVNAMGPMMAFLLRFLNVAAEHTGSKFTAEAHAEIVRIAGGTVRSNSPSSTTAPGK